MNRRNWNLCYTYRRTFLKLKKKKKKGRWASQPVSHKDAT